MFEINDYVMYGLTGACKVTDIRRDEEGYNKERKYYILSPIRETDSIIMIPIMNKDINMRKVISKEEADELLSHMKDKQIDWIDDAKERAREYNELLKSGDSESWLLLIKALADEKMEKKEEGKKLSSSDDLILKSATNLLSGEFSVALDMDMDEVIPYIRKFL